MESTAEFFKRVAATEWGKRHLTERTEAMDKSRVQEQLQIVLELKEKHAELLNRQEKERQYTWQALTQAISKLVVLIDLHDQE